MWTPWIPVMYKPLRKNISHHFKKKHKSQNQSQTHSTLWYLNMACWKTSHLLRGRSMIPHISPLKYPFFFVAFPAALLTRAKAFWSVAVIVVSAALINYNKYLMNPSRHSTARALRCRGKWVCFKRFRSFVLVAAVWFFDWQSLANSHCLMWRSSNRWTETLAFLRNDVRMWGFRIPWCCLAKDFSCGLNCLVVPLFEDPSWFILMWQTQ